MLVEKKIGRLIVFQFHKGTIKTSCIAVSQGTSIYFNSIKVQLKRVPEIGINPK